jgi:DNA topoisomerase IA
LLNGTRRWTLRGAASCTEIVNACDAGREGELIFREIFEQAKPKAPFKRLWISSLTNEAIREGYFLRKRPLHSLHARSSL